MDPSEAATTLFLTTTETHFSLMNHFPSKKKKKKIHQPPFLIFILGIIRVVFTLTCARGVNKQV